jgi:hypothetical protein
MPVRSISDPFLPPARQVAQFIQQRVEAGTDQAAIQQVGGGIVDQRRLDRLAHILARIEAVAEGPQPGTLAPLQPVLQRGQQGQCVR